MFVIIIHTLIIWVFFNKCLINQCLFPCQSSPNYKHRNGTCSKDNECPQAVYGSNHAERTISRRKPQLHNNIPAKNIPFIITLFQLFSGEGPVFTLSIRRIYFKPPCSPKEEVLESFQKAVVAGKERALKIRLLWSGAESLCRGVPFEALI